MKNKEGLFKRSLKKIIRKLISWYVNERLQNLLENVSLVNEKQEKHDLETKEYSEKLSIYANNLNESLRVQDNLRSDNEEKINAIKRILEDLNFQVLNLNSNKEESVNKLSSIEEVLANHSYKIENLVHQCNDNNCKLEFMDNTLQNLNSKIYNTEDNIQDILRKTGMSTQKFDLFNKTTTSQAGEDAILAYIFSVININFDQCNYLDLGANHAKQLSNTYFFYSMGAHGVLVEANPQLIDELKLYRCNDIILNKCISTKSGDLVPFYILNGDGLSSPDLISIEDAIEKNPILKVIDTINVETITVNDILNKYFNNAPLILNIDIEGMEMQILESIDFDRYKPLIIIIERIEYSVKLQKKKRNDGIDELLSNKGYFEYAFTGINSIYLNKLQLDVIEAGGNYDTGN